VYKKNGFHVIFVHVYKDPKEWKGFLISRMTDIEKRRHSEIMNMLVSLSSVKA